MPVLPDFSESCLPNAFPVGFVIKDESNYQMGNQQNQQQQVYHQEIHRQFKIKLNDKTHPKQTRIRTKFTNAQIEKLEGNPM